MKTAKQAALLSALAAVLAGSPASAATVASVDTTQICSASARQDDGFDSLDATFSAGIGQWLAALCAAAPTPTSCEVKAGACLWSSDACEADPCTAAFLGVDCACPDIAAARENAEKPAACSSMLLAQACAAVIGAVPASCDRYGSSIGIAGLAALATAHEHANGPILVTAPPPPTARLALFHPH